MNLSAEEKELFFKVARILQRETTEESDALLGGYDDSFDGNDIAVVLFESAGYLDHRFELKPELDPDRPIVGWATYMEKAIHAITQNLKIPQDCRDFDSSFLAGEQWTREQITIRKPEPWKVNSISSIPTSH